jgi:23S rRNA (adenine2503-C2)-methyltransferase
MTLVIMTKIIEEFFKENKVPKFRLKQLNHAIYKDLVTDFEQISTYPKWLKDKLKKEDFKLTTMELIESHRSGNTVKFVLKTHDGHFIESVLIEHRDDRKTVCVSCQVFCAVGCKFCATGANSYKRNLTTEEITEQVLFVSRYLKHQEARVTNIVYMGMGEPFLTYKPVEASIKILNNPDYFNIGARHIVVSTSGIVPRIYDYAEIGLQVKLAISLHAPNQKLRAEMMPISERYPLDELMKACDYFVEKTGKRISYEYVLIGNVNDQIEQAKELVDLLIDRKAHVNLLVYNPHEFADYKMPMEKDVIAFRNYLQTRGIEVTIRKSMGDDISGACGQLSGKQLEEKNKGPVFAQREYFNGDLDTKE